jgi:RNA-directed DNA polymerase
MYERNILDRILDRDNLNAAYEQVRRNKGVAGIDGMTTDEIGVYLLRNKEEMITEIRQRKYQPSPVLRVEIPKPNGGVRLLGIPTVKDRVIQQAISQVLTPIFDKHFSEYSYGFRPNRQAQMAITQALEFFNEGYDWIVDIDLERFFDTVHHDRLMNLVARTIPDGDVISLIRKFLVSGVQINGTVQATPIGTPQGGNLSPLLKHLNFSMKDMIGL